MSDEIRDHSEGETTLDLELSDDGTCILREGATERWRVRLEFGEHARWSSFREALIWPRQARVIAGAGARVHVLDLASGAPVVTIDLAPDLFGDLRLAELPDDRGTPREALMILGWTDVWIYDAELTLRWRARDVAVDGVTFDEVVGSVVRLHAEMDPPGGWFAVSLNAANGRELGRRPALLPGYVGLYGAGPEEEPL